MLNGEKIGTSNEFIAGNSLDYDNANKEFLILKDGVYHIVWNVLGETACKNENDVLIVLEKTGGAVIGKSGSVTNNRCGESYSVSGHVTANLKAGDRLYLINRSGYVIKLQSANGASGYSHTASVSIVKII